MTALDGVTKQLQNLYISTDEHPSITVTEEQPSAVTDLKKLISLGITDEAGLLLQPKTVAALSITDEMKVNASVLLSKYRMINEKSTTVKIISDYCKAFLLRYGYRSDNCILVDEELFKVLGYDYIIQNFLQLVSDPHGKISSYLSDEVISRLQAECKEPLSALTLRFMLPAELSDDARHTLMAALHHELTQSLGELPRPFHANDSNILSGCTLAFADLRLTIVLCTNLPHPSFSTLSAYQIALQGGGMRVLDHSSGAQSTVDIIFKQLRPMSNGSKNQSRLLLRMLNKGYNPVSDVLKIFNRELFATEAGVEALIEFWYRDRTARDLFLLADIGITLGHEEAVSTFITRALKSVSKNDKGFWDATVALLETISFRQLHCLIRLFSPFLLQPQELAFTFDQPSEEDLKTYLDIAQTNKELLYSAAFSDWLAFFTVKSTRIKLPKALFSLLTSSEHSYLPCLAFAVVSHNLDLAKHVIDQYYKNEGLKKIAPEWLTMLLRMYSLDIPKDNPKLIDQLLASQHFRKNGIQLLLASPGQYKKNKLATISQLISTDTATALRFIAEVHEEASEQQVKEWIRKCPQKALLFDALVRTDNRKWISLCTQLDFATAFSVYASTKSTKLLEELTLHGTSAHNLELISLLSQNDVPLTEAMAVKLLCIAAEMHTKTWSNDFISCIKRGMKALEIDAKRAHIHEFAVLFSTEQALIHVPDHMQATFELLAEKGYPLLRGTRNALFGPAVATMVKPHPELSSAYEKMKSRYIEEKPAIKAEREKSKSSPEPKMHSSRNPTPSVKKVSGNPPQEDPFEKAFFDAKATATLFRRFMKESNIYGLQRLCNQASMLNMTDSLSLLDQLELLKTIQQKTQLRALVRIFVEILLKHQNPVSHLKKVYDWLKAVDVDFELAWLMLGFSPKINNQELFQRQCALIPLITLTQFKKDTSAEKIATYFALAKKFVKANGAIDSVIHLIAILHAQKSNEVDFATVRELADFPSARVKEALIPLIPGFLSGVQSPTEFLRPLLKDAPIACAVEVYHKFSVESVQTIQNFSKHGISVAPRGLYQALGEHYGAFLRACVQKNDPLIARRALAIDFSFSKKPQTLSQALRASIPDYAELLIKLFIIQLLHYNWDDDNMHYHDHCILPQLTPHLRPITFSATSVEKQGLYREEYFPGITLLSSRLSYQGFLKPENAMDHHPKIITLLPFNYVSGDQVLASEQKYVEIIESFIKQAEQESKKYKTSQPTGSRALLLDTAAENLRNLIDLFPKTAHVGALLEDFSALVTPEDPFFHIHRQVVQSLRTQAHIEPHAQNLEALQQIEAEVDALLANPESTLTERQLFDIQKRFIVWQETECIDAYQERSNCLMKLFELWKRFPSITIQPALLDSLVTIIKPASRYFGVGNKEKALPYAIREATSYLEMQLEMLKKEPPARDIATPKIVREDGKILHVFTVDQLGPGYKRIDIYIDGLKNIAESRIFYNDFELFYPFLREGINVLTTDRTIDIDFCVDFVVTLTKTLCLPINQEDGAKKRIEVLDQWLTSVASNCTPKEYNHIMSKIAREIVKATIIFDFTKAQKIELVRWIGFFDAIHDAECKNTFAEQFYVQLEVLNNTLPEKILDLLPGRK
jgi:hypothetical protein